MTEPWHRAHRPTWDCVVCDQPWPCSPAKAILAEDYADDPLSLFAYLSLAMLDAIDDSFRARGPAPADLYDRFLGWARTWQAARLHRTAGIDRI